MKEYRTTLQTALSIFACLLIFAACLTPQVYAATWRVNNSTALGGEVCSPWQAGHTYATGARCVPTVAYATTAARAFVYEVTSGGGGKSHATTQPTWPTTVGNTVVDNGITWTCRSPSDGSWDNASCYLFYVTNHAAAAGDTIYIDDGHNEVGIGAGMPINCSTTATSPTRIYCVDKASDALSTGAIVGSVNYELRLTGYAYSYGVEYAGGTGNISIGELADANIILESNNTVVLSSSSSTADIAGYSPSYRCGLKIINGNIKLNNSTGACGIQVNPLRFEWRGGSLISDYGVDTLFTSSATGTPHKATIEDVDLDAMGQGATAAILIDLTTTDANYDVLLTRCKLPSDAGFAVTDNDWATYNTGKVRLHHCSSANQTYDFYERSYEGTVEDNTSIYRTGGASDGTTAISAKMVSSAGCVENIIALESIPITGWTSSTTEKTFTVEGVWDSATNIQNDEIWLELEYPADNSSGLGAIAKDKCAILGTPADQTASTETWTGTGGFSNENKFKLSVTVTPGKAGPITAKVYLAKPSTTVYIDPKITEN